MELVLIVWILCAMLCGMIASSKNRSVGGWAVAGLLLGILGVIIVALTPTLDPNRVNDPPPARAPSRDPFKR